jgi:hypothetical protein
MKGAKDFTFEELVYLEGAVIREMAQANFILETVERLGDTLTPTLNHFREKVEMGRSLAERLRAMMATAERAP